MVTDPGRSDTGTDRSVLQHRWQDRDVDLGIAGDRRDLSAVSAAIKGRVDNGSKGRDGWLKELRAAEDAATEKLMRCSVRSVPSILIGWRGN